MMNHDDSVNDRATGSRLSNAATSTRQLWAREYGDEWPFAVDGAMYRGPPPPPVRPEDWSAVGGACDINHVDSCKLRLETAELRGLPLAPPRMHPPSAPRTGSRRLGVSTRTGGRAIDSHVASRPEPESLALRIGSELLIRVNRGRRRGSNRRRLAHNRRQRVWTARRRAPLGPPAANACVRGAGRVLLGVPPRSHRLTSLACVPLMTSDDL